MTEPLERELLPCPFCNGIPKIDSYASGDHYITCINNCITAIRLEKWQSRPTQKQELDEVKSCLERYFFDEECHFNWSSPNIKENVRDAIHAIFRGRTFGTSGKSVRNDDK